MNDLNQDEPLDELEQELSRLRPQRLSANLSMRIADKLDHAAPIRFADRCLMTFMGAGALAASIIIGLVTWQVLEDQPITAPPAPARTMVAQQPVSIGDYQLALGRADGPVLELLH